MTNRWQVVTTEVDGPMVPIGGAGDSLPRRWTAALEGDDSGLRLTLRLHFDGIRVELVRVTLDAGKGDPQSITPANVARLRIAEAVYVAGRAAVQPGHGAHVDRRPGRKPDDDEIRLVAAVYGFEYAAWGEPRQAIMGYWQLPRTTATRWIRKAAAAHGLPGSHSEVS